MFEDTPIHIRCASLCPLGTTEVTDENGCTECSTVDILHAPSINCPEIEKCPSHCKYTWNQLCRQCACKEGDGEYEGKIPQTSNKSWCYDYSMTGSQKVLYTEL